MKKIYSLIAAALLFTGLTAGAAPAYTEIAGTYTFSATITLADGYNGPQLISPCTVTVRSNPYYVYLDNFLMDDFSVSCYYDDATGELEFDTWLIQYPYRFPDGITFTIAEDGTFSVPDFTIINADTNQTAATMSHCSMVRGQGGDGPGIDTPTVDFPGSYKITGTRFDYTKDVENPTKTEDLQFTMSINDNLQLTAFAGYDVTPQAIEYGYNTGEVKGDTWSIETNSLCVLEYDFSDAATGIGVFLGGGRDNEYRNQEAVIAFTKTGEDEYTLSDFTVWAKTVEVKTGDTDEDGTTSTEEQIVWKLLYRWTEMTAVTGTADKEPDVEEPGNGEEPGDTTAVDSIGMEESAPVYYDLQGRRITEPLQGIYIKVSGGKTVKTIIR